MLACVGSNPGSNRNGNHLRTAFVNRSTAPLYSVGIAQVDDAISDRPLTTQDVLVLRYVANPNPARCPSPAG